MKLFKNILPAAVLFISATPAANTYNISKDYTVGIHGTSNLHDWNEKVEMVSGDAVVNMNSDGSFDLTAVNIKMDVHSIKSEESSIMNNNTYKALKADTYPKITFTLYEPIKSIKAYPSVNAISAKGKLTIAGVTNPVIMKVKVFMPKKEIVEFEGSQTIKMTDYGIDPPTALFGTLKTGNEITINFKTSFTITTNQKNS